MLGALPQLRASGGDLPQGGIHPLIAVPTMVGNRDRRDRVGADRFGQVSFGDTQVLREKGQGLE